MIFLSLALAVWVAVLHWRLHRVTMKVDVLWAIVKRNCEEE